MEDFEKFKERHILEEKEIIKKCEDRLKKIKFIKSQFNKPTPHQIEKLSRKKKKVWVERLEKYKKLLSMEKILITNLELAKRALEACISAKKPDDMIELICQRCGEHIFGMVCDLCGCNNYNPSDILKIAKEEILFAEKHGLPVDNAEKTDLKIYENLVIKKKKNDEMEQFILNTLNTWKSCENCGKEVVKTTCEDCGFDNTERKKNTLLRGIQKLSDYYDITPKEAIEIFQLKMQKLKEKGKIYTKY